MRLRQFSDFGWAIEITCGGYDRLRSTFGHRVTGGVRIIVGFKEFDCFVLLEVAEGWAIGLFVN